MKRNKWMWVALMGAALSFGACGGSTHHHHHDEEEEEAHEHEHEGHHHDEDEEEKEDFADHGEKIIFDDEGVKFECMTKPYGFVAPDSKVWFQKFLDDNNLKPDMSKEDYQKYLRYYC